MQPIGLINRFVLFDRRLIVHQVSTTGTACLLLRSVSCFTTTVFLTVVDIASGWFSEVAWIGRGKANVRMKTTTIAGCNVRFSGLDILKLITFDGPKIVCLAYRQCSGPTLQTTVGDINVLSCLIIGIHTWELSVSSRPAYFAEHWRCQQATKPIRPIRFFL